MQVLLLDIEGTTTPIDFVYKTLFPYARQHMNEFVNNNLGQTDLGNLKNEYDNDQSDSKPGWSENPTEYLLWLMDQDRKSPALKSIQGQIWQAGYDSGELKGELFSDVLPAIKKWKKSNRRVCIYSSGSVLAQKLLFGHSTEGDLTEFIDAYFDTGVGAKKEKESYIRIAQQLNVSPADILFVSDSKAECEAASEAGCQVRYSVRSGNKVEENNFQHIESFDEL